MSAKSKSNYIRKLLGLFVSILSAVMIASCVPDESAYSDVSEQDTHYEAIIALTEEGIVEAYEDGRFGQWDDITRQDSAKLFFRAFDLEEPENIDQVLSVYDDLDSSHPYAQEIAAVIEADIFQVEGDLFYPEEPLSRQEAISFLLWASDLDEFVADEKNEISMESVDPYDEEQV